MNSNSFPFPIGKPDPPIILQADVKATAISISVHWRPGFDGGSPQTFTIQYNGNGRTWTINMIASHNPYQVITERVTEGIQPDTSYTFTTWAANVYGTSDRVVWESIVTPGKERNGLNQPVGDLKAVNTILAF